MKTYIRKGHNPSGYILGWVDKYGKMHTKSIPITSPFFKTEENIIVDVKTELLLLQLELAQQEFETGKSLPPPVITRGLSREQVKLLLNSNLAIPQEVMNLA